MIVFQILLQVYFFLRLPYEELFGGVEMFSKDDFVLVNGFSNSFWGWGAEDDNLYKRYPFLIYLIVMKKMYYL